MNATRELVKEQVLGMGHCVLPGNVDVAGKHKLLDEWRSRSYVVVGKMGNLPVY